MKLVTATEADSSRLKEFFARMSLPGAIDYSIERQGNFFDQYRVLSDQFETYMLEDDKGEINGMASLIFKEGFVLGEKQTWAFATDLRISPSRRAIAQWSQYFLPVLERAREERRCRYVFSAVEQHDNQAYNALIRPTSHARRRLPRYLLANRFRWITLHARVPFAHKPLKAIRLKEADLNDVEPLSAYLRDRAKARPLADLHTPESLVNIEKRWPGLKLSDFRVAYDSSGNVRGCSALWDGRHVQHLIPQGYNGFQQTLHQTLSVASLTGLVRPTPKLGQVSPTRFLTHLSCDSAEIFHRLVDEAYSRLGSRELLSYVHFRGNWRTLPPTSFMATTIPYGLYLLLPPSAEAPPWPTPSMQSLPPEFELAWL